MKNRNKIAASAFCVVVAVGCYWHWLATYSKAGLSINIPKFIAGSDSVAYSIYINKTQLRPYGTVWKTTFFKGGVAMFPQIEGGWDFSVKEETK